MINGDNNNNNKVMSDKKEIIEYDLSTFSWWFTNKYYQDRVIQEFSSLDPDIYFLNQVSNLVKNELEKKLGKEVEITQLDNYEESGAFSFVND